jgi:predicted flap endonuclease-1-like 5' DNA nuclease
MSDLLTQMLLYMLGAFLLGLFLGWLLWGRSRARLGGQSAEDARLSAKSDHLKGELDNRPRGISKSEHLLRVLEAQLAEFRAQPRPTATVTQAPVQRASTPSGGTAPAKPAKPDKLRKIIGIGPVNERLLYEAGVTTFEQIAAWTAADIERIERILEFGGRIERERWVEQARLLAAGEEKEFLRRFPTAGTDKNT